MGNRDNSALSRARRQHRFNLIIMTAAGIIIVIGLAATFEYISPPPALVLPDYLNTCLPATGQPLYISTPTIGLVINGQPYTIPANIGVSGTCVRPISTRSTTGVIHIDALDNRLFTIHDFFLVWGATYGPNYAVFNKNQLFYLNADSEHNITMTVNGQVDSAFENQVFPTNANATSLPYNVIISFG